MSHSVANPDARAALVAALSAGTMMAQLVAGKATRDTLFLSAFGARRLPVAMAVAAAVSLIAIAGSGRLMVRLSPARVVPAAFHASALAFILEWLLLSHWPAATAFLIYLHIVSFGAILSSGFWSVVTERFDPHAARLLVSRIALGGSLGGLLGGLLGWQLASFTNVPAVLWLLAALASTAGYGISRFARTGARPHHSAARVPSKGGAPSAAHVLRTVPYLRNVAAVVLLGASIQALLDYTLAVQAGAVFGKDAGLMTFFSLFYAGAGILALGVQLSFGPMVLERWGVAVGAALLPMSVLAGAAGAMLLPGAVTAAVARGTEAVFRNSVYRASYELLYTPLSPESKRPTKAWIDVGFDRVGTALGSGLVLLCLAASSAHASSLVLGAAVALCALCAWSALRLRRGYVTTLADGLRRGALELSSPEWRDSRTLDTLTATAGALDRRTLLREIERLHQMELAAAGRPATAEPDALPSDAAGVLAALTSPEPDRVRRILSRDWPWAPLLVAPAIDLLERQEVASDAVRFLREQAPRATGQLLDALLDSSRALSVRRRLPRVLKACPTQRCAEGLLLALSAERFEVRLACARALFELTSLNPALQVDADKIQACILAELNAGHAEEPGTWLKLDDEDIPSDTDPSCRHHGDRRLEYIFRLLSLVHDREAVSLAWKGLRTGDQGLRGTALEYLDNVLSRELRDGLFAHLDIPVPARPRQRSGGEARDELLRSRASIELQVGQRRRSDVQSR